MRSMICRDPACQPHQPRARQSLRAAKSVLKLIVAAGRVCFWWQAGCGGSSIHLLQPAFHRFKNSAVPYKPRARNNGIIEPQSLPAG
jgi:hypothetical protein